MFRDSNPGARNTQLNMRRAALPRSNEYYHAAMQVPDVTLQVASLSFNPLSLSISNYREFQLKEVSAI